MNKLKLLILDANIVIHAHEIGVWENILSNNQIYLSETVIEESNYFVVNGTKININLNKFIEEEKIKKFHVSASEAIAFKGLFNPYYIESIDDGELESLAYLHASTENFRLSSADAIVFKILSQLGRSDQGISFETILNKIGLGAKIRKLEPHYTEKMRLQWDREGGADKLQGKGLKRK